MHPHRLFESGTLQDGRLDQPVDFANFTKRTDRRTEVPGKHGDIGCVMPVMRQFNFRMVIVVVLVIRVDIKMRMNHPAVGGFMRVKVRRIDLPGEHAREGVDDRDEASH